jgi:alpha-1,2-mannosyltransferase
VFTGRPSPGDFVRRISRPGSTWLVAGGVLACALAVVSYVLAHPGRPLINWYDFRVYWDGGLVARHSPGALYSWQFSPEIRFTYTPFAASLFALMSLMPWTVAKWLMTAGSLAALLATIGMTFRQLGWAGRRRLGAVLLVAAVAFWFEPVQRAVHLGQVELILMALIVWDLGQPSRRWWQGAGIGLAAGIKLVPLIFIPYLLLTRRFRQAGVAVAVLAATMTAGFLVLPRASRQWWLTGYFLNVHRTGGVASLANQSLRGLLTRMAGSVAAAAPGALAAALAVAVIGLLAAAAFYQSGRPVHGWVLCALTGLLVSPISWDHHWVWTVPVLVLLTDAIVRAGPARRWILGLAAAALAAVFFDWPGEVAGEGPLAPRGLLPLVYGPGAHPYSHHLRGLAVVFGNAYVFAGLVLFGAMIAAALFARQSRALPPLGRSLEPLPSSQQAEVDPELVRD